MSKYNAKMKVWGRRTSSSSFDDEGESQDSAFRLKIPRTIVLQALDKLYTQREAENDRAEALLKSLYLSPGLLDTPPYHRRLLEDPDPGPTPSPRSNIRSRGRKSRHPHRCGCKTYHPDVLRHLSFGGSETEYETESEVDSDSDSGSDSDSRQLSEEEEEEEEDISGKMPHMSSDEQYSAKFGGTSSSYYSAPTSSHPAQSYGGHGVEHHSTASGYAAVLAGLERAQRKRDKQEEEERRHVEGLKMLELQRQFQERVKARNRGLEHNMRIPSVPTATQKATIVGLDYPDLFGEKEMREAIDPDAQPISTLTSFQKLEEEEEMEAEAKRRKQDTLDPMAAVRAANKRAQEELRELEKTRKEKEQEQEALSLTAQRYLPEIWTRNEAKTRVHRLNAIESAQSAAVRQEIGWFGEYLPDKSVETENTNSPQATEGRPKLTLRVPSTRDGPWVNRQPVPEVTPNPQSRALRPRPPLRISTEVRKDEKDKTIPQPAPPSTRRISDAEHQEATAARAAVEMALAQAALYQRKRSVNSNSSEAPTPKSSAGPSSSAVPKQHCTRSKASPVDSSKAATSSPAAMKLAAILNADNAAAATNAAPPAPVQALDIKKPAAAGTSASYTDVTLSPPTYVSNLSATTADGWEVVDEMEGYEQDERDWAAVKALDRDIPRR